MLQALAAVVAIGLVVAGILVMMGPSTRGLFRRLRSIGRPTAPLWVFQAARTPDVAQPGLNPKTQRVMVAAARLTNWLRAHGHDEIARELRSASARMQS